MTVSSCRIARVLLAAVAFPVLAAVPHAVATPPAVEYEVTLEDGVRHGATSAPGDGQKLHLLLRRSGDNWGPVSAWALTSMNGIHEGVVVEAREEGRRLALSVLLNVHGDGYVAGGRGVYDLDLSVANDGTITGAHEGTFADRPTRGSVTGARIEVRQIPGTEPVQPGEHPHLLFRKSDIPALKVRLATPFGQAFRKKAEGADKPDLVGLGVLYQLTGDKAYAQKVRSVIERMDTINPGAGLSGSMGHGLVRVVVAYDLCRDGWAPEFAAKVAQQIQGLLPTIQRRLGIGHSNYHPCSNYYGPGFGSAAIAALALYGLPGDSPPPPPRPFGVNAAAAAPPAKGYTPGEGVPVSDWKNDTMPTEWLFAGGFKPLPLEDCLQGKVATFFPDVGTVLTFKGRTRVFQPIPTAKDKGYWHIGGHKVIDVTNAIGRDYFSTTYFFTVIRNDKARRVRYVGGLSRSRLYLAGAGPIRRDEVARIEPGLYPILLEAPIGTTDPWGRHYMRPRLVEIMEAEADATREKLTVAYERDQVIAEKRAAAWERSGGMNADAAHRMRVGHMQMLQHYRLGMGDGGFQAEVTHYGNIAAHYPLIYAALFQTALGRSVSHRPDVSLVVPRQILQTCFPTGNGKPHAMALNVKPHLNAPWCAAAYPVVPDEYKPYVHWAWNRVANATDAPANVLTGRGLERALAFVNYPLDSEAVHPAKGLRRTWRADTFGYYVFRSGWEGKDDIIAQVFGKTTRIGGWSHPNAGAFRLWGLGHAWTSAPIDRNGYRPEESVVLFPDDQHNEGGSAWLTRFEEDEATGSGTVTFDMAEVYGRAVSYTTTDKKGKTRTRRRSTRDRVGEFVPEALMPDGTKGLRSLAFDYTGKCGAPALVALFDRIEGGGKKQWLWQLPAGAQVSAEGSMFTIDYPDGASLRGTFVSPEGITCTHWKKPMVFKGKGGSTAGKPLTRHINAILAETEKEDVDFLVVATLQKGTEPPDVRPRRRLGARIGKRTVRFDGEALVVQ